MKKLSSLISKVPSATKYYSVRVELGNFSETVCVSCPLNFTEFSTIAYNHCGEACLSISEQNSPCGAEVYGLDSFMRLLSAVNQITPVWRISCEDGHSGELTRWEEVIALLEQKTKKAGASQTVVITPLYK